MHKLEREVTDRLTFSLLKDIKGKQRNKQQPRMLFENENNMQILGINVFILGTNYWF